VCNSGKYLVVGLTIWIGFPTDVDRLLGCLSSCYWGLFSSEAYKCGDYGCVESCLHSYMPSHVLLNQATVPFFHTLFVTYEHSTIIG
jgi:hypothetical protein